MVVTMVATMEAAVLVGAVEVVDWAGMTVASKVGRTAGSNLYSRTPYSAS